MRSVFLIVALLGSPGCGSGLSSFVKDPSTDSNNTSGAADSNNAVTDSNTALPADSNTGNANDTPSQPTLKCPACTGLSVTYDSNLAQYYMPSVCCDANLSQVTGCNVGSCAPPACSSQAPHGACGGSNVCNGGTCIPAVCNAYFYFGTCSDPATDCVLGECVKTGCNQVGDPNAYCAPNLCSVDSGLCYPPVVSACSAADANGACASPAQVCCNSDLQSANGCTVGTCFTPSCSPSYPAGACPTGQVCAQGVCQSPLCNSSPCTTDCGESGCPAPLQCDFSFGVCVDPRVFCINCLPPSGICNPYIGMCLISETG